MTTLSLPSATCVAIDLETTGLRPEADEIIEVGAVLFHEDEVLATFHRLIDPGRPLPAFVSLLTGISAEELRGAQPFSAVLDPLREFLGDHAVVGQSVSFDLAFLARQGIVPRGPVYDTRDLSRLLRPQAAEHSLAALASTFGVTNVSPHRASPDAETTMRVFQALRARLAQLQSETLATLLSLALRAGDAWSLGRLVQDAAGQRGVAPGTASGTIEALRRRLREDTLPRASIRPRLVREGLQPEAVASLFAAEGELARTLPGYEPRPQQVTMASRVGETLGHGGFLLVEAPAGTGKSLAYLVPALSFAWTNQTPVAVSTSTRGLQEQLATKDLPEALRVLNLRPEEVPVAVLKGRGNYLCLARLSAALERPDLPVAEIPLLAQLVVWLETTARGDLGELSLNEEETSRWESLSAGSAEEHAACPYQRQGLCFLARSRREAQGAYLIVTNHAFLLADSTREGGGTLGHVRHLVLDEAHNLEREATEQYAHRVTRRELEETLSALGAAQGRPRILASLLARAASAGASARVAEIARRGEAVGRAARAAGPLARSLYQRLARLFDGGPNGVPDSETWLRLTAALRTREDWRPVAEAWEELGRALGEMARALDALADAAEDIGEPDATRDLEDLGRRLAALRQRLEATLAGPGAEGIAWASRPAEDGEAIILRWAPLSVGPLLQEGLLHGKEAVVLVSATLAAGGSFAHIAGRLGLKGAGELLLDSPFDYRTAAAVFVPSDMPEPDSTGYQRAVESALVGLGSVAGGGVLALFTSHGSLRQAYTRVRGALQRQGIAVLGQGIDGPPARLAEVLRRQPGSVLLGAASFWEGVDLPGDALRVLVITRLPFSVPGEPVTAARAETYPDPFNQFTLPESLLRFRQGLGRLIRSGQDQGAIVLLDARVLTRSYGASYLEALPPTSLATPSLAELPQQVAEWLRGGRAARPRQAGRR